MSSSVAENIVAKSVSFDSIFVDGSSIGHGQVITKKGDEIDATGKIIASGEIKLPANALITTISMVVTTPFVRASSGTTSQRVGTSDGGYDVVNLASGAMSLATASPYGLPLGRGNSTDVGVRSVLHGNIKMVLDKAFFPEATSLWMEVHSSSAMTAGGVGFIVEFIAL